MTCFRRRRPATVTAVPSRPRPAVGDGQAGDQRSPGAPTTVPIAVGVAAVVAAVGGRPIVSGWEGDGPVTTWTTVFVSTTVQALPFLALGVVLSAAVTSAHRLLRCRRRADRGGGGRFQPSV